MKKNQLLSLVMSSLLVLPGFCAEAAQAGSWRNYTTRAREAAAQEEADRQARIREEAAARQKAAAELAAQPRWRRYTSRSKAEAKALAEEGISIPAAQTEKEAVPAKTVPAAPAKPAEKAPQPARTVSPEKAGWRKYLNRNGKKTDVPEAVKPAEAEGSKAVGENQEEPAGTQQMTDSRKKEASWKKYLRRAEAKTASSQPAVPEKAAEVKETPAPEPDSQKEQAENREPSWKKYLRRAEAKENAPAEPAAEKKVDLQSEPLPTVPKDSEATWEMAASNSRYQVYFDSRSLEYDEKTGIITVWSKWSRRGGNDTYLYSRYDVRLKTYADLYRAEYGGRLHGLLSEESVKEEAWAALSPHTLGMELCNALNTYLLNH
jgi:hypothetical protein